MRTRHRRASAAPLALLATGALAAALIAPAAASADAAARAERLAQRTAQRAARTAEREARRAARQKAHDERREARESEQAKVANEASTPPSGNGTADEGGAPSGGGTPGNGCRPTLKASSSHVLADETVTLTGTIGCAGVQASAGQQVTITENERGTSVPASAAPGALSAVTTADGSFEVVTPALQHTTVFKIELGRRGARAVVKVAPSVTLNAPASATLSSTVAPVAPSSAPADETTGTPPAPTEPPAPAAHGDTHSRVTFTGAVAPAEPDSRVALQVAYGTEGWKTVALARVAADGSYSVAHRFRKAGQANVRVIAHMHGHNVNGVSPTLAYEVTTTASPAS